MTTSCWEEVGRPDNRTHGAVSCWAGTGWSVLDQHKGLVTPTPAFVDCSPQTGMAVTRCPRRIMGQMVAAKDKADPPPNPE